MHYLFLDGSCVFEWMPFFLPFSPTVHLVQVKKGVSSCRVRVVIIWLIWKLLCMYRVQKRSKNSGQSLFRKMWVMLTSNTIQAKPSPQTSLQLVTLGEKDSAPEYHPASQTQRPGPRSSLCGDNTQAQGWHQGLGHTGVQYCRSNYVVTPVTMMAVGPFCRSKFRHRASCHNSVEMHRLAC